MQRQQLTTTLPGALALLLQPRRTLAVQVTVRFNMGDGEITKDQIKEFETANPTIKIQREDVDTTKLAAQLATGEAPDIIRMTGVNDLPSYVIRGIAMDLTKYIDTSTVIKKDDFVPTVDVYRFDEQGTR